MAASPSQATRMGSLTTPLGSGRMVLKRFVGSDFVNSPFEYRIEALDTDENVDFEKILGKRATVTLDTVDNRKRYFHGVIAECAWIGPEENLHAYTLTLRPSFWLATLKRNQRIFHEMSVVDIVNEVLGEYDHFVLDDKTTKQSDPFHYIVQYRESDFDFVSRMLERCGINYHFEHSENEHKMVLTDGMDAFPRVKGDSRKYVPQDRQHVTGEERFWDWDPIRRLTTGKIKLADFNHATPVANMVSTASGDAQSVVGKFEAYDFPGGYLDKGKGDKVATVRVEQERALDRRQLAKGDVLGIGGGYKVKLTGDHDAGVTGSEYLCLQATHAFFNGGYSSGSRNEGASYSGSYVLYPADSPYMPERKTPEARIDGPQTATVVGASGTEIDVDEGGRILVHFPWDLDNRYSMRVRCAQLWAHKNWGAMFIPRLGMEVVVVFIEGDPNNPLVVGCVYNGANKPPWELPGEKNVAGIKSRSTMNGGEDNFNEISFDDTKGSELFNQQAERDMKTLVKRNERRDIWVDRTTTIGQDEERLVKRDEKHTIERDQTYDITDNSTWEIGKDEFRGVGKNRETEIGINDTLTIGSTLKVEAGTKIELICGQSKITMTPASIEIKSIKIDVKATAQLNTEGTVVNHKASGPMTIKGAVVMIN